MNSDCLDALTPDRLPPSQIKITYLSPDQWQILRDLKLRSLDQEPIAFANVDEERAKYLARTKEEWRAILSGKMSGGREGETVMLFAEDNGRYIGMVSAIIPAGKSIATVQHMYIDKEGYRRQGIGKQLLSTLLTELKRGGDLTRIELDVVETQTAARELYKSLGFYEVSIAENGAQRGTQVFDEVKMALDL